MNLCRRDSEVARDSDGRPGWMRTLSTTAAQWLSLLPEVCLLVFVVFCVT